MPWPDSSGCGAGSSSTPWVGTTTGSPPSAGCRTTSGSGATRASPSTPTSSRRPEPGKEPVSVSRPNFVALCNRLTVEDEQAFEHLWRMLGLSVDWSHTYATVSERARRVSQRGFLRLAARGQAVQRTAPTLWDVDFRTAVSQAELEDRERPGAYHRLRFPRVGHDGRGGDRDHPARAAARLRGPGGPPRRRALPTALRHPRSPRRCSGCRVPVLGPPAGRPREGLGHRHGLHLRRHHRRGVVARAVTSHPDHRRPGRPTAARVVGYGGMGVRRRRTGPRRPTGSWPAARSTGPDPHRRAAGRVR